MSDMSDVMSDTSDLSIPSVPPLSPILEDSESEFFYGGIPENDTVDDLFEDFGDFDLVRVSK